MPRGLMGRVDDTLRAYRNGEVRRRLHGRLPTAAHGSGKSVVVRARG